MKSGLDATKLSDGGINKRKPTFIVGSERSGTNLLRRILGTHSDVSAPHPIESSFPASSFNPVPAKKSSTFVRDILINMYYSHHALIEVIDVNDVVKQIDDCSLYSLQQRLYEAFASASDSSTWVSKWPSNIKHIESIDRHYDSPRYIHLVRDCRDNVLSKKNNEAGSFHPYFSAQTWRDEQKKILNFTDETDSTVHLIRYEDLLDDPEASVRSLCESLGLSFEPEMLLYYETDVAEKEAQNHHAFENLNSPIKSDNYNKFRDGLTDDEIIITEKIAGEYLEQLGYSLVTEEIERNEYEFEPSKYRNVADQRENKLEQKLFRTVPKKRVKKVLSGCFDEYMRLRYYTPYN
jgi:hypothetical protein